MRNRNRSLLILVAAAVLAIALAACGGEDDNSSSTEASSTASTVGGSTVSVQSINGNDVLVDADGNALYTNDMDTASTIACTGECSTIWVPLTAPRGGQPSSDDSSVNGNLGTVDRPDGTSQVTFDGKPLYSFVQDSPGQATGDGFGDSFGGTDFVWTAASVSSGSASTGGAGTTTSSDSGGGGSSGYGY